MEAPERQVYRGWLKRSSSGRHGPFTRKDSAKHPICRDLQGNVHQPAAASLSARGGKMREVSHQLSKALGKLMLYLPMPLRNRHALAVSPKRFLHSRKSRFPFSTPTDLSPHPATDSAAKLATKEPKTRMPASGCPAKAQSGSAEASATHRFFTFQV